MGFDKYRIDRRDALMLLSASAASLVPSPVQAAPKPLLQRTGMGLVIYDCNLRRRWMRQQEASFDLFEPLTFLKHCKSLGAGGMQANLGVMQPDAVASAP